MSSENEPPSAGSGAKPAEQPGGAASVAGRSAPSTASIFANALASTPKYVDAGVSAGMHNTLVCSHCGAARETASLAGDERLVCRYCKTPFGAVKARR